MSLMFRSKVRTTRSPLRRLQKLSSDLTMVSIQHVRRSLAEQISPNVPNSRPPTKQSPALMKRKIKLKNKIKLKPSEQPLEVKPELILSSSQSDEEQKLGDKKKLFLPFLRERDSVGRLIGSEYEKRLRQVRMKRKMHKKMNSVIDILDVTKHIQGIERMTKKLSTDNYFTLETEEDYESAWTQRETFRLPENWKKKDVFERRKNEQKVELLPKVESYPLRLRNEQLKKKLEIPPPDFKPGKLRKVYKESPSVWAYNPSDAIRTKASPSPEFGKIVGRQPRLKQINPPKRLLGMSYSKKTRSSSDQRSYQGSDFDRYAAQLNRNLQKQQNVMRESYNTMSSSQNAYGIYEPKYKGYNEASTILSQMVRRIKGKHSRFHSLTDLEDIPP